MRLPRQPRRTQRAGLDVIGISPDKPAKLAKFRDDEGLTFPLLSDPDREVLTAWGAFGEKTMYGKTVQGVIRSTFVVDEKGKIEVAQYNVRATGHVAKLGATCPVVTATEPSSSSASAVAARSSTPRCRLSLMLCACVAGLRRR